MKIIAGTGHRPKYIWIGSRNAYNEEVYRRLVDLAEAYLLREMPDVVISGMALGWDMALAEAALSLNIRVWAYVPFPGQECKWPAESQRKYRKMLEEVEKVWMVSEGRYSPRKMHIRDEAMVDDCTQVVALYNGDPDTGTGHTVAYAEKVGRPVRNLWSIWDRHAGRTE